MKKLLLSLPLVATLLFAGCNDNLDNRYRITGYSDIDSLNGKWVYIFESLEAPLRAIDSAKIDNNKFTLSGVSLVQPYKAPIIITNDGRMPVLPLIGAYIVVEPGEIEVVISDGGNIDITGTPQNDMISKCENAMSDFEEACADILKRDISRSEKKTMLLSARDIRNKTMLNALKGNMNTEIALEIFRQKYMYFEQDQLDTLLEEIKPGNINDEEMQIYQSAKNTAIGKHYTDFALNDPNGNGVKLSDFVGKHSYVLIDFWASWCGPCRRAIPGLQEIYDSTTRDKFEVVAVSLDSDKDKWEAAIQAHGLKWPNMASLDAWHCTSAKDYAITFIPSTVLIDSTGTIVSRNANIDALKVLVK